MLCWCCGEQQSLSCLKPSIWLQENPEEYSTRDMHVGRKFHLKIGISPGTLHFLPVRAGDSQYFFIYNHTLDKVIEAQSLSAAYEVVLSQPCWVLSDQQWIRIKPLSGKNIVKVVGMRHLTRQQCQDALGQLEQYKTWDLEGTGIWRSALTMSSDPDVEMRLEKHLPRAVLCKLRQEVLWELYSELWPITSLFVQLQFADKRTVMELSKSLSDSSRMISEIISFTRVKSTKLFCLTKLVSIGVSSGTAYCSLTGHPERFEYTGQVSCDAETYVASCLPSYSYCFKELPKRNMKGVTNPITAYEYMGITKKYQYAGGLAKERSNYGPLLGRKVEINLFEHCLEAYKNRGEPHILAFVGVPGSGKSHLLPELAVLGWAAGQRCLESSGIPYYCEELLCYLRCSNMLLFHTGRPDEGGVDNWQSLIRVERSPLRKDTTQQRSGTLAFCTPLLWEATYELWPMRQRVGIHRKCAAFLERHTHKCQRDHGGEFVAFHRFGVSSSQEQRSRQGSADKDDWHSWETLVLAGEYLRRARTHAPERFLAEGKWTTAWDEDGAECSCQCEVLTEAVLVPLAHHYTAVSNASQAFYYLLECVAAYLHVSNSSMAPMKLKETEILRNNLQKQGNPIDRFEEATSFILKGEVCRKMGQVKLAKRMIRQALSLLGMWFPRTSTGAFVKSVWERLQHAPQATGRESSLPQDSRTTAVCMDFHTPDEYDLDLVSLIYLLVCFVFAFQE
ncbi:UNVERIFIED_CONTAM: hypothetical protein H355_000298 [Colinus virginianus]|nr:hypothetical protein H355_000298 [Colinus virginianus]